MFKVNLTQSIMRREEKNQLDATQWRTQEFCSGGGGSTNSVEDRENEDLGAVTP